MNKKDCTQIAYLLSKNSVPSHIAEQFFNIDNRIKSEYELFEDVEDRSGRISELAAQYAREAGGENWCLRKNAKELLHEGMKRAKKEITGEE